MFTVTLMPTRAFTLKVQSRPCSTCIYRRDSPLDIRELETQISDPRMPGFFLGHRVCHHSDSAVCAGFWSRHKDDFALGQIAQRLGAVEFVRDDNTPS